MYVWKPLTTNLKTAEQLKCVYITSVVSLDSWGFSPWSLSRVLAALLWGAQGPWSWCAVGGHQGVRGAGFWALL